MCSTFYVFFNEDFRYHSGKIEVKFTPLGERFDAEREAAMDTLYTWSHDRYTTHIGKLLTVHHLVQAQHKIRRCKFACFISFTPFHINQEM